MGKTSQKKNSRKTFLKSHGGTDMVKVQKINNVLMENEAMARIVTECCEQEV